MQKIKIILRLLWLTLRRFIREDALNHGATLAFYTVFAFPAILMIIISMIGYFWGEAEIEHQLFSGMSGMMGEDGARVIQQMLDKVANDGSSTATWVGVITLLFSSTVVFYTIQHSLNRLWDINHDIQHGFIKYVLDKFLSLAFIIAFGFLLMVSLVLQTGIAWMNKYFKSTLSEFAATSEPEPGTFDQVMQYLHHLYVEHFSAGFFVLEFIIVLAVNAFLFTCIFKYLPDAKVKWKVALPGGLLTALLFEAGQDFIGWKLSHTDFSNTFGSAGAIIVVFMWIFYSSTIIFFGGIFVDLYGKTIGEPVRAVQDPKHKHE